MWKVRKRHQKRQKRVSSGNCFTALLLLLPCNCKSLLLLLELGIVVRYFTRSPKLSFQSAWLLCLVVSYESWTMLFSNQKVFISSSSSSSHFPLVFKFLLLPFKIVSTPSPQSWLQLQQQEHSGTSFLTSDSGKNSGSCFVCCCKKKKKKKNEGGILCKY
jgi:hypothetical protein